jgi:hypothetical protein
VSEELEKAREEVISIVEEWARGKPWLRRELTPLEARLKEAAYSLERARRITGAVRVPTDPEKR